MGKHQSETVLLVVQVWISFHCDNERELWPGVEHIFFEDNRHISERSELVVLVISEGESYGGDIWLVGTLRRLIRIGAAIDMTKALASLPIPDRYTIEESQDFYLRV